MALLTRRHAPDTVDDSTTRTDRAWDPWRIVAVVLGLVALIFGIWAMTRTGLNTDHPFSPTTNVLGLPHTPALGLGLAVFGILALLATVMGMLGRTLMAALGGVMLAFGVIVVVDAWPGRVDRWTAASGRYGWAFVVAGAVAFLAATTLPNVRHHSVVRTREVHDVETRDPEEHSPRRHWWQPRREQTA